MTRLWLVTESYPYGGGETFITAELPYLLALGVQIHIVPTTRAAQWAPGGARPLPEGVFVRGDIVQAFEAARRAAYRHRLRCLWRRRLPVRWLAQDVVHALRASARQTAYNGARLVRALGHAALFADVMACAPDGPRLGDALYAYWLGASALGLHKAFPSLPLVARAHGHDLFAARNVGNFLPLQRQLLMQLRVLYCISDEGAAHARTLMRGQGAPICVMSLGVPQSALRARPSTDGVLRIVSCARVVPVKDLDRWIAALHYVRTPVIWTHLGDGPDRARLVRLACALPKHIQVHWAGAVEHDAVLPRITQQPCDLFINTSRAEGRPVSVMEALSVGLCVRAPALAGIAEMLPAPWLFDPAASACAIARCIDAFAALPATERESQAQTALELWRAHASAEAHHTAFAKDFEQRVGWTQDKVHSARP